MSQSANIPFISQNEIYHFGLDMLEVFGTYRNEAEFNGLDFDNSHSGMIEEFGISKHDVNSYLYKIQFSIDDVPLFAFYKGNKKDPNYHGSVKTEDYFCFYAGLFHIYGEEGVSNIIRRFSYITRTDCIKRFDICMDIPFSTPEVYTTFNKIIQKKTMFYGKGDEIETLYIGEKQNTKNKYSLLRIYNKLKDLYKKGKVNLYAGYFDYDNMTRIELEVRRELAKNVSIIEVFSPEKQMDIFLTQITKHTSLFNNFPCIKTSLFRKREIKDWETISNLEKEQRVKLFLSYAEKMSVILGICPIQILLEKNIFLQNTISMLEKYGINNYISILHNKRNWRIHINNILDRDSLYGTDSGN